MGGAEPYKAADLHLHSQPRHVVMKVLTVFKEAVMESGGARTLFEDSSVALLGEEPVLAVDPASPAPFRGTPTFWNCQLFKCMCVGGE